MRGPSFYPDVLMMSCEDEDPDVDPDESNLLRCPIKAQLE